MIELQGLEIACKLMDSGSLMENWNAACVGLNLKPVCRMLLHRYAGELELNCQGPLGQSSYT